MRGTAHGDGEQGAGSGNSFYRKWLRTTKAACSRQCDTDARSYSPSSEQRTGGMHGGVAEDERIRKLVRFGQRPVGDEMKEIRRLHDGECGAAELVRLAALVGRLLPVAGHGEDLRE